MQQSPSSEAKSRLADKEIPLIICNSVVHSLLHPVFYSPSSEAKSRLADKEIPLIISNSVVHFLLHQVFYRSVSWAILIQSTHEF